MNSNVLICAKATSTAPGSLSTQMTPEAVSCLLAVEALILHFPRSAELARESAQIQSLFAGFRETAWVMSPTPKVTSGIVTIFQPLPSQFLLFFK
jgi:hypothetical protein